jgi:hypothetical protein
MKSNVGPIAEETGATSMALKQIASNRKASHPPALGQGRGYGGDGNHLYRKHPYYVTKI